MLTFLEHSEPESVPVDSGIIAASVLPIAAAEALTSGRFCSRKISASSTLLAKLS